MGENINENEIRFSRDIVEVKIWVCETCDKQVTENLSSHSSIPYCEFCDAVPSKENYDYSDYELEEINESQKERDD